MFCGKEKNQHPDKKLTIESVSDHLFDGKYKIQRNITKEGFDVILLR
jgi:hypothetical protein